MKSQHSNREHVELPLEVFDAVVELFNDERFVLFLHVDKSLEKMVHIVHLLASFNCLFEVHIPKVDAQTYSK